MQLSLCVCTQLDILVVFVDYLKQLSDDSPDFANTRGTLQCTICVNQYQFECLFMPYMCAVVNIVVVGILTITCFQLFFLLNRFFSTVFSLRKDQFDGGNRFLSDHQWQLTPARENYLVLIRSRSTADSCN